MTIRGIFFLAMFLAVPSSSTAAPNPARFTAIQFTPDSDSVESNRQQLAALIKRAASSGSRYIVLPELALTGSLAQVPEEASAAWAESVPGPTTQFFAELARNLKIWIAFTLAEHAQLSKPVQYYVSVVLLDDTGAIVTKYRKVNPRYTGDDGSGFLRGSPRTVLESLEDRGRRIGVVSGDDVRVAVPRLATRGADTILVSANWSSREPVHWRTVCYALSQRYHVNLVVANLQKAVNSQYEMGGIYLEKGKFLAAQPNKAITSAVLAKPVRWHYLYPPLGLPSIPTPTYDVPSPSLIQLGRELFFDRNLSSDHKVSCGTCHQPDRSFTNGQAVGIGVNNRRSRRNVPTLLNVAYRGLLFWDGASSSLENQAKYPMGHFAEMNMDYYSLLQYVRGQVLYQNQFAKATGHRHVQFEDIALALAAYERTLLSGNSPFDQYYYRKNREAMSASAQRGLYLFQGKAQCSSCHLIGERYSLFMDNDFHNTGVGFDHGVYADLGLANLAFEDASGKFLTPTLRNVAETGPYMHDGSIPTLNAVVEFYDRGGNPNPHLDSRIHPLRLSETEKRDLVEFLRSLTGSSPYAEEPPYNAPVAAVAPRQGQ